MQQRDTRLLAAVAEAGQILLTVSDLTAALTTALTTIGTAAEVDRIHVIEHHPHPNTDQPVISSRFIWHRGQPELTIDEPAGRHLPLDDAHQRFQTILDGGSVNGPVRYLPPIEAEFLQQRGIQSLVYIPIRTDERIWGFVSLNDTQSERAWSAEEQAVLASLASSIGSAIIRQRSTESLRRERQLLAAVAEAGRILLTVSDLPTAIQTAFATIGKATEAERIHLVEHHPHPDTGQPLARMRFVWDRDSDALERDEPARQNMPIDLTPGSRYRTLEAGESIHGSIQHFPPTQREYYQRFGLQSLLSVPVFVEERLWGSLNLGTAQAQRAWSAEEQAVLNSLADSITGAITRQQTMDDVRAGEARSQAIISNALVGIITIDERGTLESLNQAAEDMFGYQAADVIGQNIRLLMPEPYQSEHDGYLSRYRETGVPRIIGGVREVEGRRSDGSTFPMTLQVSEVWLNSQRIFTGVVQDVSESKRTQARVLRQLEHLNALRAIDMAITGSLDLRVTLNVVLDQVVTQLSVDAAAILLLEEHTQQLTYAASRGFQDETITRTRTRVGVGIAGRAAFERRLIRISDVAEVDDADFVNPTVVRNEQFRAYFAVPLIAKGRVSGVLQLFHRTRLDPSIEWFVFLESLAMQTAIAVIDAALFSELQRSNDELILAYDTTLEGWARALELRDDETEGHSRRVTDLTIELARALDISGAELSHMQRGALLHDIGKIGIPDAILLKPGPLDEEEWALMRQHPRIAYDLLSSIAFLRPALDIPYRHHEKWDGSGYPDGLRGVQIPLAARIFTVVDIWDALLSERPYRQAWSREATRDYIASQAGTHFDPQIIEMFLHSVATT